MNPLFNCKSSVQVCKSSGIAITNFCLHSLLARVHVVVGKVQCAAGHAARVTLLYFRSQDCKRRICYGTDFI